MTTTIQRFRISRLTLKILSVLLLVSFFAVAALGLAAYQSEKQAIEDQVVSQLSSTAMLKKQQLTLWLEERKSDVRLLAVNWLNQEHFSEILSDHIPQTRKDEFALFLNDNLIGLQRSRAGYREISIVDPDGVVRISTNADAIGQPFVDQSLFQQIFRSSDDIFIKDIFVNPESGAAEMAFGRVMYGIDLATGIETGEAIGVVITYVLMEETIFPLLGSLGAENASAEIFIVRSDGGATRYLSPLLFGDGVGPEFSLPVVDSKGRAAHLAARGESGVIQALDYSGKPVLAAYRHIDGIDWGFVAKEDLAEALAPVGSLAERLLFLGVVVLLASGLIALVGARALARPLAELAEASQKIASGDLTVQVNTGRSDEIGALARSFQQMVNALQDREHQSKMITHLLKSLNATPNLIDAFDAVATGLRSFLHSDSMSFSILHSEEACFEVVANDNESLGLLAPGATVCVSQSASSADILAGRPHFTPDLALELEHPLDRALYEVGYRSRLNLPLKAEGRVLGMLSLGWYEARLFSKEEISLLLQFTNALALAVERSRLFEETRQRAEDLEQAHQELRRTDQLKDDFIRNITHELKTPVATLSGYAEMLLDESDALASEQHEMIEIVSEQAFHLARLVKDVVAIHQLWDNDKERRPLRLVNLARSSLKAVQERSPVLKPDGRPLHEFRLRSNADDVFVHADRTHLRAVIDNLLDNAVKFSPEGGAIELSVNLILEEALASGGRFEDLSQIDASAERWIQVSVSDRGIGISPDALDQVWERFYQVDGSSTRHFGGTGLGLALVKETVDAYRGQVWIESEPGAGTRVSFALPIHGTPAESTNGFLPQSAVSTLA